MMHTRKDYYIGQNRPCKPEKINWSDKYLLIHRTLIAVSIQDFIALAEISEEYYFKMLASDLQHPGIPSVNLQRVYREHNIKAPIEKVDGFWALQGGQWICTQRIEK